MRIGLRLKLIIGITLLLRIIIAGINLPDYKTLYHHIKEFYSTHRSITGVCATEYFDKTRDNCIFPLARRKSTQIIFPTKTAIKYYSDAKKHEIRPYKRFNGNMSTVYDEQSKLIFQNRPDVVIKKKEIGVEVL